MTEVEPLVAERRRWLGYLERKLGDRTLAEDVLQEAFVRTAGKVPEVEEEALAAWFRRVLKNAAIDVQRRAGARAERGDAQIQHCRPGRLLYGGPV